MVSKAAHRVAYSKGIPKTSYETHSKPQKTANSRIGATGQSAEPKNAIDVVIVVKIMAYPALGRALAAISSVLAYRFLMRKFFH